MRNDSDVEVAVKCVRIEIPDDRFKDIVNKVEGRLPQGETPPAQCHSSPVGYHLPVPAIVSPWMHNGSLSTCLDKHYDRLSEAQKFGLISEVGGVRWAAPELFEVPDTEDAPGSPKLILSGQQPYCDIRSDHPEIVVAILKGINPKRPEIPAIEDCHRDFIKQCWLEISRRSPIVDI
ncbi:uncharacterized protein EDB91DRAFT_1339560 [Suillus paluster]|uniref:uncharacterized protein n=1 Tax=Suillus paluster TaxID=48578 RepID=UPI001B869DA3|nr:uncharacterized protein EDB91DRAFT_1340456 [Suillus paluster]XP_041171618.1 uncharacterized protein EDB91DRAFT_1339560 [Suillus paluster]KAG1722081.1 hypothetical protein EDB91DRAFT_1340456 [Suillus paluster]KAG1726992.1 hypothetical protein EDB91DRAFT_1339560 [Suillus paluster]